MLRDFTTMLMRHQLLPYFYLMRLDKPIGILLLLWPTLWALWLAANQGQPQSIYLVIFGLGTILMRSAGCVINDLVDRQFDPYITRTRERPIASGKISPVKAIMLAGLLSCLAFVLVLFCNRLTIELALMGGVIAVIYPFLKRITHLPQLGLGVAFTWGVPMAFAAETKSVSMSAWYLFFTGLLWPIIYDTMYAMVDRQDDLKVGVKSTAILFAGLDKLIIGLLQILFIIMLVILGFMFQLHFLYYISLLVVLFLFIYQQWLIKDRDEKKCFQAFLNNNWVGFAIFLGILSSYWQ